MILTRAQFEHRISEIAHDPRPSARLGLFGDLLDTDAAQRARIAELEKDNQILDAANEALEQERDDWQRKAVRQAIRSQELEARMQATGKETHP